MLTSLLLDAKLSEIPTYETEAHPRTLMMHGNPVRTNHRDVPMHNRENCAFRFSFNKESLFLPSVLNKCTYQIEKSDVYITFQN